MFFHLTLMIMMQAATAHPSVILNSSWDYAACPQTAPKNLYSSHPVYAGSDGFNFFHCHPASVHRKTYTQWVLAWSKLEGLPFLH